ncbi:hypothetical protein OV203_09485 [Nannocystis sp. ILAH1]|uniref:hypothetical protein n=1 Tax=Nannocystis sp. ILAH1 TaxID=2996789 RepID=UPI00227035E4|nr:hypothetical protein [Nannocystis sp. ILAH1]MCY0987353.1 hypothetical protein [Nannocystis sp. ILAH1]
MRPTAERLLACGSEESFLAALDTELCRTEGLARLVAMMRELDGEALTAALADFSARTDESVDASVLVTTEELRDELRHGFEDAAKLARLLVGPTDSEFVRQTQALSQYDPQQLAAAGIAELGGPRLSPEDRRVGLAVLRSTGAMFVLAVAADTGRTMPLWMAELAVRLWRQGHEQLLAHYEHRSAPALREERSTPIASLLFSFVWLEPDALADILTREPATLPLLREIATNLPKFFGGSIDHLRLRPNLHTDGARDELAVDVCVTADAQGAPEALERFDEAWWFDAARASNIEIVVDLRRV